MAHRLFLHGPRTTVRHRRTLYHCSSAFLSGAGLLRSAAAIAPIPPASSASISVQASVNDAVARYEMARQQYEAARREIERETRTAYLSANASHARKL